MITRQESGGHARHRIYAGEDDAKVNAFVAMFIVFTTNASESSITFKRRYMLEVDICQEKKGNVYGGASRNAVMVTEERAKQRKGRVSRVSPGCCITTRYDEWDRFAHPRVGQTEIMALIEFIFDDKAG